MSEKVLVVDDDEEFANLLGLLLSKKGYESKVVYSGQEAIDIVAGYSPAIILQDYMLPDIFGTNLLKRLKEGCDSAHIIIITAKGDEEVAVSIMKAGASDYLKKPFDTEKLLMTIENVLKLRSSEAALGKLNSELFHQNQHIMALTTVSNLLISNMRPGEKYKTAVGVIMKDMQADFINLLTYPENGRNLTLLASDASNGDAFAECMLAKDTGLASYVAEIKKTATVADFASEKRFKVPEDVRKRGIVSALGVPVVVGESVKGVLLIYSKATREFSGFEMKLMSSLANQIALSLMNDSLHERKNEFQSQWQATFDLVPERITVQDTEHRILMANKAAADATGLTVKEVIGQQCSWVFHNQKEPIAGCPVDETLKTKKPAEKDLDLGPAGKVRVSSCPILKDDGELLMVVEYVRKIS